MLGLIALVLIVRWLLGFLAFHISVGVIHLLLVVGVVLLILHLVRGSTRTAYAGRLAAHLWNATTGWGQFHLGLTSFRCGLKPGAVKQSAKSGERISFCTSESKRREHHEK